MVGEPGITVGSKVGTTDGTGVGMRVGIDVATCRSVNDSLMKSFFLSDMGKNVTWMIEFNRRGDSPLAVREHEIDVITVCSRIKKIKQVKQEDKSKDIKLR